MTDPPTTHGDSGSASLVGQRLGNYRLDRELGRGRMGVVYLATDVALLRPTAIKVLACDPAAGLTHDAESWFLHEARNVARVSHPSVVQIYGVARHGPHRYIAMEYVDGVSAGALVAARGPFAADRATEIVAQIAGALELAHLAGIVHRDVKPANVLVAADGAAKLGDFGMALHRASPSPAGLERAGTPLYIAPEVWRGEPASPASDIYALGATYFYLLTGRPPFATHDLAALEASHLRDEVDAAHELRPELPAACTTIIRRCMAKRPAERYAAARELEWELRGLLRALHAGEPAAARNEDAAEWAALGFVEPPFAEGEPIAPYDGEPFAGVRHELIRRLRRGAGAGALLTGAPGSGRTLLARHVLGEADGVYLDLAAPPRGDATILQRVARAFGALPRSASDLEGLLDHLRAAPAAPLLILDGVTTDARELAEIELLQRAAASTRYLGVLLVGLPELGVALRAPAVAVPPLGLAHARPYLVSRVAGALAPGGPPIVVTPDAALLVGRLGGGNPRRMNRIAAAMLRLAARGGRRIASSWEAWAAAEGRELPRPAGWPSGEALAMLNACRDEVGAPALG